MDSKPTPDLDPELCRRARLSRDPRFDGAFFLGVCTTGIYCRPVCPARPAAERNVTYFRHAAQAAAAGYRPCLRCRPESAPGSPAWLGSSTTVHRALGLIAEGALNDAPLTALAERLGVGERYLRKLFQRELGASPRAVAHHQRLLFARKLITETRLPLTEVAFSAGFGSVRRFNSALREAFGEAPGALRRHHPVDSGAEIELLLPYRPPYDWEGVRDFFARHALAGLETVDTGSYRRLTGPDGAGFVVRPAPDRHALKLCLSGAERRQLMPLVARVRRMFDLDAQPLAIATVLEQDPLLAPLLAVTPGIRAPRHGSPWEAAVRAIVGQQISVAGARTVLAGMARACGAQARGHFPRASDLLALSDRDFAMPARRRETLRALCRHCHGREERLSLEDLGSLPGVGPWTTQLVAMRGFGDPDAFPATDLGLLKAWRKRSEKAAAQPHTAPWRPWRAYAANLLWRSL